MKTLFERYLVENQGPERFVDPSEMSSPEKASEFQGTPEGGYIRVNKRDKKKYEDFWREHEQGHWEYFNQHVLPSIEGEVTQAKVDQALEDIRVGYPNNKEEIYAFNRQIEHFRSLGMGDDEIFQSIKDDYMAYDKWDPEREEFFKKLIYK